MSTDDPEAESPHCESAGASAESPRKKRVFGAFKGQIALTDAFFEPLPDDELALWNGEGD